ncbi:glutathione S-transferase family protein [Bosea sp. UNC402CLCol]|uniref:glutathione S-transferase family protein n=1 Tax=Bosea sp. UNC402CLCol TaxID=1510531 RepID=UPI000A7EDFC7|nr:glutathione S-transferase family protein [Bosea sp. UNC402CLCol]
MKTMLKIYGRRDSSNCAKAFWALDELGVGYELIACGGRFGGTDTIDYRAFNPHGKVPTVVDDGAVVWESNAVLRYLGNRYGKGAIWPPDAAGRASADQWMDWGATAFVPAMGKIRTALKAEDAAAAEAALKALTAHAALLDRHFQANDYLAGPSLTLADIALAPAVHRWFLVPLARPDLPSLAAYRERLAGRDGYRRHVAEALS